ncbi:Gfo/Idh/MocA family protein [Edaphobacter albus]|uniref:Gfo/Idh/MocA family protein n=1 Tax=Edaphobacter sp. 4G125 TaxID=2763071 RepID=UPI0016485F77|nr:Gfo/Idh/MocA family oxidoreductase [Edaphobacter sp. 4G125]QNI35746.1 Gfo/Idh/MocA family oxidoreductase [Edaphobacter sp. 4G125]
MQANSIGRRQFLSGIAATAASQALPHRVLGQTNRIIGANDRIRIGLIGAGSRGTEDLRSALRQHNVECAAVADVFSLHRERMKHTYPFIDTYDDPRRLLDRKDIDAVINATPLHVHSKYFLDTLSAGKDLYCEKTMTWNIPEAEACLRAAKASKQIVQIGLQDATAGSLLDAKDWIANGLTGKITMVESWMSRNTKHGVGQWRRPIPKECTASNVNWKLFLDGRKLETFDAEKFINWRLYWSFSGGNTAENMVHQLAWVIEAMNLPLPKAAAMTGGIFSVRDGREVPDTISVTIEYPNDFVFVWQSVFNNKFYGMGERFLGSDGTIEHLSGSNNMITGPADTSQDKESEENAPGPVRYYPETLNNPNGTPLLGKNPGENHMAHWVARLRDRKQPAASVELGYRSALGVHMANLSYRQKRRITLEEALAMPASAYLSH